MAEGGLDFLLKFPNKTMSKIHTVSVTAEEKYRKSLNRFLGQYLMLMLNRVFSPRTA
jgi:hypothetical protein